MPLIMILGPFQRFNRYIQIALFFVIFFVFTLLYVLPGLFTVFNGVFRYSYIIEFTNVYAASVFCAPGGIATTASAWFVLACETPILGAVLLTFAAIGLFSVTLTFCKKAHIKYPFFLNFVPSILFLSAVFQYNAQYFPFILALLGSIALALAYQRLSLQNNVLRVLSFFGFCVASYYFFSIPGLFFCVLAIVHDSIIKRKFVLYTIGAAIANLLAIALFKATFFPFDRAYPTQWIFDFAKPLPYMFAFIPVLAIMNIKIPFIHRLSKKQPQTPFTQRCPLAAGFSNTVMTLGITAFTLYFATADFPTKTLRELGRTLYYVKHEQWNNVLALRKSFVFDGFPNHHSNTQLMISNAIYRALFHTGSLGTNMLSFPQVCDPEPLILRESAFTVYFPAWVLCADVGADLGLSLFAEKVCGEGMENMGPHPALCLLRSQIQIARGNTQCGIVYLNKVKNMPGFNAGASKVLHTLQSGASFPDTTIIGRLKLSLEKDSLVLDHATTADLLQSTLKSNPKNKMAFEYLMAYYLLTRQLSDFAQNLYRLDDFGYTKFPSLYEEAFVIYQRTAPDSAGMVKLPLLPLSKAAFADCDRFLHTLDAYSQYQEPQKVMLREFGDTYYYLYTFGVIPQVRS